MWFCFGLHLFFFFCKSRSTDSFFRACDFCLNLTRGCLSRQETSDYFLTLLYCTCTLCFQHYFFTRFEIIIPMPLFHIHFMILFSFLHSFGSVELVGQLVEYAIGLARDPQRGWAGADSVNITFPIKKSVLSVGYKVKSSPKWIQTQLSCYLKSSSFSDMLAFASVTL